MKNEQMLLIGGIVLVGAFMFKDQICQAVPGIPLLCDAAGGGKFAEDAVADCAKQCPGGARNEPCLSACAKRAAEDLIAANYAGYY